jgi:aspartate 1-decarboxylase
VLRTVLKSRIDRVAVTRAQTRPPGSVTLDEDLMDAADLLAGERVAVVDVATGARQESYLIPGERGSGVLGLAGPGHPGDLVALLSYGLVDEAEAAAHRPRSVSVDERNRITGRDGDPVGAGEPAAETDAAAALDALLQAES